MKYILILFILTLFSCKIEPEDTVFRIYHLQPNSIYESNDNNVNGSFSKRRNDFFVIKNYDIQNENHKIKIDSFVVNYIKKDSFLLNNDSVKWRLTFFKYGDGINENTKHIDGTDYAIHNLFSYKKELASYYFDTSEGYNGTNYNISSEEYDKRERKIVANFIKANVKLQDKLKRYQEESGGFNPLTFKQDTIRVLATLINEGVGNKIKVAQFKFEEPVASIVILEGDMLNVGYNDLNGPYEFPEKAILTLIKDHEEKNIPNYFVFPEMNPKKGIEGIKK